MMAADQIVVVKKSLKGDGAKGLACSDLEVTNNHKLMGRPIISKTKITSNHQ